jgi:DNA-directed RNA polymerase II subunit RPB11
MAFEDHTMGNLLRMQLLQSKDIKFAGYRVPHPLEDKLEIKVQANKDTNPIVSVVKCIDRIVAQIDSL